MFDDARSRFGDARRGAPTASRHAQWSSAVKPRFWGSTLKFTVKSLKWYTFQEVSRENVYFLFTSFHLIHGFWEKRNSFMIFGGVMSQGITWINCCLHLAWSPRLAWKDESCEEKLFSFGCKGCKAGIISDGDNTFSAVSIKGEVDQKMQKNTGKWSRRSLRIKSRR